MEKSPEVKNFQEQLKRIEASRHFFIDLCDTMERLGIGRERYLASVMSDALALLDELNTNGARGADMLYAWFMAEQSVINQAIATLKDQVRASHLPSDTPAPPLAASLRELPVVGIICPRCDTGVIEMPRLAIGQSRSARCGQCGYELQFSGGTG